MAHDDLSSLRIEKSAVISRSRRKKKRIYYIVFAVLALLVIGALYRAGALVPAASVQAANVTQVYPSQTFTLLNASGYVVAQRKSALASKVTGRLVWLGVEEGSKVRSGEVVARLENQDVTAAREQARANLNTARWNLDQAKAELSDATLGIQRATGLIGKGYIAQADYDTALARYNKADAAVRAGEAMVSAAEAALKAADVSLEYTLVRAPFDAVILTKNADVGDIVTPLGAAANAKASVVSVADMGSLKVEADVSESNLEQVKLGQPCEIQLDAIPGVRFKGKVHMIVPTADRTKATVLVKVGFIDNDPRVLPEMSAKVAFLSRSPDPSEEKARTAVNRSAVTSRNGKDVVFVVRQDKAFETPVVLGGPLGDMEEVRQGVEAGDRVVVNPGPGLKDGSKVTIVQK
jgi:RND family efflux transporter MFP subunit